MANPDHALGPLLDRLLSPADRARLTPHLAELSELAAGALDRLATTANAHPPTLRQYSPGGERIDEIEYHPSYRAMMEIAFGRFGLAAMSHRPGVLGWPTAVPHVVKYALSYVFVQAEFGLACPLSMTDSAARVLRRFDGERYAAEIAALTSTDLDTLATGAMFMTEEQGGSDVGQTATAATDHGTHWTLRGRKWFASNVAADVVLTLARVPGQGPGTGGLGMFLVPRRCPDGSRNAVRIDRLKDKLGTRSMASGEVTLDDAWAQPVGELTSGFRQLAEMVNVSRLSNAMRAAALMRRAVVESVGHARERIVFGRPLFEQPLMRVTLARMTVDAEAALGLVLEAAARLDDADSGDTAAARLIRVLTPLAKHTLCAQARRVTGDAMEVRGGNGYIEDWVNPRLLRDAHLGSIWEGSSHVIALDVLRCMRRDAAHHTVADTYRARVPALAARWDRLVAEGDALLAAAADRQEMLIGRYTDALTHAVQAALLLEHAAANGPREQLVAETFRERLTDPQCLPLAAASRLEDLHA